MGASEFEGRVVAITGGAQGIGKCLVQSFTALGAKVCFADLNETAGRELESSLEKLGHDALFVQCDLAIEADVRRFCDTILGRHDRVALLINNVGVTGFGKPFATRPFDEWNRMLALGLSCSFLCAQLLADALELDRGAIVNIASTRALMSEPDTEAYSAAKGGLVSLTHSLAITLGPRHIRVNCISPGWIDVTGWQEASEQEELSERAHRQHPVGRVGTPEDVAAACVFLGSERTAGFITGHNLVVDGGMTRKMVYEE